MGQAWIAKRLNDLFGTGFVTLADLGDRIPGEVFAGWAAYINEYDSDEQVAKRAAAEEEAKRSAEHDELMKMAAKAARR